MNLLNDIIGRKRGKIIYGGDLQRFKDNVYNYKVLKKNFVCKQYGGSAFMYMGDGRVYIYGDHSDDKGKGFHICRYVKEDIEEWIENNPSFNYDKYVQADYKEQLFNLKAVERNMDKVIIGVDINNCYFQTGHNTGYITKRVFDMGCKKMEEWKDGRNASIGTLAKTEIITLYEDGKKIYKKNYASKKDELLSYKKKAIRNHIIGNVYRMFLELIENVLHKDFCMFLTDCIYVDAKYTQAVQDFFASKGYASKFKQYAIRAIDTNRKVVVWWDYVKKKDKWYQYANHQVYGLGVNKFNSKKIIIPDTPFENVHLSKIIK